MTNVFDNLAISSLSNPLTIQYNILNELQERLTGGEPVVDSNNVFSTMLEMFSSMTGHAVDEMIGLFSSLYSVRAQSFEDLYKHMSDYDYVGLFSNPASCEISFDFDKAYLIANAASYNENYKKIIIPKNSIFRIGKYYFGIYYPIEIKINKQTETFIVTYDTTTLNSLQTLSTNIIEHREYTYSGVQFISIKFPVYQFEMSTYIEDISSNTGFIKVYEFTNKFYAMKIYHFYNNEWIEINQTLSSQIYDPSKVTAKLLVECDTQMVKVSIPQVYFTDNLIGTKLKIELYTTRGELDANISEILSDNIGTNFKLSSVASENTYSLILDKIPTLIMTPISTKIVGGSNGYSFAELQRRVINDTFYDKVLITPGDLINKFEDVGFTAIKYIDNLTDRIYFCYKELTDSTGVIVSSAIVPIYITVDIVDKVSTISLCSDGSIMILPGTMFKYIDSICYPIEDTELNRINNLSNANKIIEYNENIYSILPYHTRIDTSSSKIPLSYSYDLTNPVITSIEFLKENIHISSQISIYNASISYSEDNTGYDVTMYIKKTDDLSEVSDEDIVVYVMVEDYTGEKIYIVGTYLATVNTYMQYTFHIATNFNISDNHVLDVTNFSNSIGIHNSGINLTSKFEVILMVDPDYISDANAASTDVGSEVVILYAEYIPTIRQALNITLGNLISEIYDKVDITYTGVEYATWPTTEYATYSNDIYERDEDGNIVYTVEGNSVILNKLYSQGDNILDENDNPIVLHAEGDIILDTFGQPTINKNRSVIYLVDTIQVDAKIALSQNPNHITYLNDIRETLRTYYEVVNNVTDELIENTALYFRPLRTIGYGSFGYGDDLTISLQLELTISLKIYVEEYILSDTTMVASIRSNILDIIDEHISTGTIELTAIVADILDTMSNDIKYVDIVGINNDATIQTLINTDNSVRPSLKRVLYVKEDGTIDLQRGLNLEFIKVS